jgi:predicted TIM-barrel fold metal-dependent hydrolase
MAVNQNIAKARMFLAAVITTVLGLPLGCPRQPDPSQRSSPSAQTSSTPPAQSAPRQAYTRSAYPILDVHTHIAPEATRAVLALFDERNVQIAVNLSAGFETQGLEESLAQQTESGGRILPFCTLPWRGSSHPDFVPVSIQIIRRCHSLGVKGLKIPKVLGLGTVDTDGTRLKVDSPRLDPIFEELGQLGMVVLIHSGDPKAFFEPATPSNERWEELRAHPAWSFHRPGFPTFDEILSEFERRVLRHPQTKFIGAHFGNAAEEPARVSRLLERAPNYYIDTSARVPEFGRHSSTTMRTFFERWQDRVLFGTDLGLGNDPRYWVLGSGGDEPTSQRDVDRFFTSTFRYFESNDGSIENPTPIQGRWPINTVHLPGSVLRKIYGENAARLLDIPWPPGRR